MIEALVGNTSDKELTRQINEIFNDCKDMDSELMETSMTLYKVSDHYSERAIKIATGRIERYRSRT